jgi:hypothetical protein
MVSKQYNETQVRELKLYEENNGTLYKNSKMPIYENLDKKRAKGTYDGEKSEKLWKYHADRSAKEYEREYGSKGVFTPADRREVAKELREEYEDERGIK